MDMVWSFVSRDTEKSINTAYTHHNVLALSQRHASGNGKTAKKGQNGLGMGLNGPQMDGPRTSLNGPRMGQSGGTWSHSFSPSGQHTKCQLPFMNLVDTSVSVDKCSKTHGNLALDGFCTVCKKRADNDTKNCKISWEGGNSWYSITR